MSHHAHFARLHAARALAALERANARQPLNADPMSADPHYQLGAFKAHVETLTQDIENLLKEVERGARA